MKYAIFSDVHSNLEAFQKAKKEIDKEKVDQYLFLGDIVGYGANPRECIKLLGKMDCISIGGNHDWGAAGLTPLDYFNSHAREAIEWTKNQLREADKKFLSTLPLIQEIDPIVTIVHATLHSPSEWNYIFSAFQAHTNMEIQKTPLCFVGHSHVPITFFETTLPQGNEGTSGSGPTEFTTEAEIHIEPDRKYLINVGSVGQPRDGNPQSAYAIYDQSEQVVEIKRVAYDIGKAKNKILEAGLPEIEAERLERGQ